MSTDELVKLVRSLNQISKVEVKLVVKTSTS
jgi:hypothetical protein